MDRSSILLVAAACTVAFAGPALAGPRAVSGTAAGGPRAVTGSGIETAAGTPARIPPSETSHPQAEVQNIRERIELPAPANLASTNDPAQCSAHGGFGAGLACKALLPQGRLGLVWDYPARGDVTGFHIYRVDGGQKTLVYDQANGAAAKAWVVEPPHADGYASACYAVSAYSASDESEISNAYCGSQARLIQTVTLKQTEWLSVSRYSHIQISSPGLNDTGNENFVNAVPLIGFNYQTMKQKAIVTVVDTADNFIHRLGLHFDITPVMHRKVVSARLELEVTSAWAGKTNLRAPEGPTAAVDVGTVNDIPTDHQTSCAAKFAEGTARWWNFKDWIDASPVGSAAVQGPDVSIDVTSVVNGWANYARPNFGLVLIGGEENLNAFTESSCVTRYDPSSFKLVVQYY